MARRHGGRIYPHQRDTDNAAPILGEELGEVSADFKQLHLETLKLGMDDKCRKNYRARIIRIVEFWSVNNKEYYEIGVKQVSEEELRDESKFYYNRYKTDLIYQGMNVNYVLNFLISTERRNDGKLKSYQDIRKYRDAILWGAKVSGERLPQQFYEQIDVYLGAYKKKFVIAKKTGEVDEHGADPISFPLYELLLQWAIESNNVFVWFWTVCQWNFMARSASIDPLAFHNFSLGTDSIIGRYDDSKADKTGDRLSEKKLYANPNDWRKCFWTGLGIYTAINQDHLSKSERFFLSPGTKEGIAANRYCEQLMGIVARHEEEVSLQIRYGHMNPYGLRKGAATHAISGTTAAPSIPSIARRGEWSQGAVFDVYWHFAKTGDEYLGRVLVGLDPNDVSFGTLPPHWTLTNPLEDNNIKKAMTVMYGGILKNYKDQVHDPKSLLLRCLACIIFHSDKILDVMVNTPGHDFSKLSIFHDRPLLEELKKLVTTAPTPGVMITATGIPPHIGLASQLRDMLGMLTNLVAAFQQQSDNLIVSVEKALENKAWESGHVTGAKLKEILKEFHGSVNENLEGIRAEFQKALIEKEKKQ